MVPMAVDDAVNGTTSQGFSGHLKVFSCPRIQAGVEYKGAVAQVNDPRIANGVSALDMERGIYAIGQLLKPKMFCRELQDVFHLIAFFVVGDITASRIHLSLRRDRQPKRQY